MATDPACKALVEPYRATATIVYAGCVCRFCSDACRRTFAAHVGLYARGPGRRGLALERIVAARREMPRGGV